MSSDTDPATRARQRLTALVDPTRTAVLTMEMQQGVIGAAATFPQLGDECRSSGMLDALGRLCGAARRAGAPVVHCTVVERPDGLGSKANCKVFALSAKLRTADGHRLLEAGTDGPLVVPELGRDQRDLEVPRITGMTPFSSTELDQILRNLGITTVIATGVSVNLGIMGMVLGAIDRGYDVVLPRDAVAGVPNDYAQSVIDNSLSLLATLTTVDDVIAVWQP